MTEIRFGHYVGKAFYNEIDFLCKLGYDDSYELYTVTKYNDEKTLIKISNGTTIEEKILYTREFIGYTEIL